LKQKFEPQPDSYSSSWTGRNSTSEFYSSFEIVYYWNILKLLLAPSLSAEGKKLDQTKPKGW